MDFDETPVYIPVEEVTDLLGVSLRQATRYAKKVRTQQDGRRIMYHRDDVEKLARERNVKHDRPLAVHTEIMPPGKIADLLRETQTRNEQLSHENGKLVAQLQAQQQRAEQAEQAQRQLVLDTDETRRQLVEIEARAKSAEAEAERLRLELDRARRSWWRRLFSK